MVWASSCSRACFVLFVLHPVSRSGPITSIMSTANRRRKVLLFIKSFASQFLAAVVFRQNCYGSLVVHHCPQECALQNPPTEMVSQLFACVLFCNPQYRKKLSKSLWKGTGTARQQHANILPLFRQAFNKNWQKALSLHREFSSTAVRKDVK